MLAGLHCRNAYLRMRAVRRKHINNVQVFPQKFPVIGIDPGIRCPIRLLRGLRTLLKQITKSCDFKISVSLNCRKMLVICDAAASDDSCS